MKQPYTRNDREFLRSDMRRTDKVNNSRICKFGVLSEGMGSEMDSSVSAADLHFVKTTGGGKEGGKLQHNKNVIHVQLCQEYQQLDLT
jgi:hypothetical protein